MPTPPNQTSAPAPLKTPPGCHCSSLAKPPPAIPEPSKEWENTPSATTEEALFYIPTLDCPAEEAEIRAGLKDVHGLHALHFRLGEHQLRVRASPPAINEACIRLRRMGFEPTPIAPLTPEQEKPAGIRPSVTRLTPWLRPGMALGLALASELMRFLGPAPELASDGWVWSSMGLAALAIWMAGFTVYQKGLTALRSGRLNINALMSVAVTGAFLIGEWPEAAMVMALYTLAEQIEARAVDRARHAIQGLMALMPDTAEIQDAAGTWVRVAAEKVGVGALVRLSPGERVPLDGYLVRGEGSFDQALLTGESLPVEKQVGDPVFAGTLNLNSALEYRVSAVATQSTLAHIINVVETTQAAQAPTQRWVDRFAVFYTPCVFFMAVMVSVLAPPLLGWEWRDALYRALVLLVIACPCALVISTPVTVVSGLTAAARRGILIKGGIYLEQARKLKAIAFDKTGTLTQGKPQVVAFEPFIDAATALQWAQNLAARSSHPVSGAIAAYAPPLEFEDALAAGVAPKAEGKPDAAGGVIRHKTGEAGEISEFREHSGRGLQGIWEGRPLILGNHRWIHELGLCTPALEARLQEHEQKGCSITLLASETRVLALYAVADTLRPEAADALQSLKAQGITPVMLTGDHEAAARAIAQQAGISEVYSQLLPEEKLRHLARLQQTLGPTAMVGDGLNDAPALAQADIGFAMGAAGTDIAMEAADVVILKDDLSRIADTLKISRKTHTLLWQNISLALGIKALFLGLALMDQASMWMAVFADMGASLLVVFNGLRLLAPSALRPAGQTAP